MNCQELTELLDNGDLRHLAGARRREVDAHLAGCPDCAAEWRVQIRIATTPIPPPLPGFIEMCRRLVAAGAARRFGGRLVVVGALVVLAAAAAVLGWYLQAPAPSPVQVVAASVVELPAEVLPVVEPSPEPTPQAPKPQPVAPLPQVFTVAVWPLQSEGIDTEGTALAERFRERVITVLQSVPNLVMVDTQPGEDSANADYELHIKYEGTQVAPLSRDVKLEIHTAAEMAADKAAIAAEASMTPEERQRSHMMRRTAGILKQGASLRGGNTNLSLLLGTGVPTLAIIEAVGMPGDRIESSAQQLVKELRVKVFPLDESFEQQELATLSNISQRDNVRVRALGALLSYAERRGGFPQMSPAAVRAGGEFALTWQGDIALTRSMVWEGMALTRSPELVPYLIRGLNESPNEQIRLLMVKILAGTYADDPRAKAALAAAAKNNDQQTVRMAAMREAGDSRWVEYVGTTLMDRTLTDLQRLQPIADMAPGESATLGTSPKSKLVLDDQQLDEFVTIITRIAPDPTAGEVVRKALFAAGAMDTPAALDMLIEVVNAMNADDWPKGLTGVAIMGVRQTANSLISFRYRGNPKARAVIENLASSGDPLEKMMAELQLKTMDMSATSDTNRQEEQAAAPPVQ